MSEKIKSPGFFLKKEWGSLFEMLPNEDIGIVILNLYRNYDGLELLEMSPTAKMLFIAAIKPTQDHNQEKYEQKVLKNQINGAKGGAPIGNQNAKKQPKTSENNPKQHKDIVTDKTKVKDNIKDIVTEKNTEIGKIISNSKLSNSDIKSLVEPVNDVDLTESTITKNNREDINLNKSTSNNRLDNTNLNYRKSTSDLPPGSMTMAEFERRKMK